MKISNQKLFINLKLFKIVGIKKMLKNNFKNVLKYWKNFLNLVKEILVKL